MARNEVESQSKGQILDCFQNASQNYIEDDLVNSSNQQLTSLIITKNNDQHLAEIIYSIEIDSSTEQDISNLIVMGEYKRIALVADKDKTVELIECLREHCDILAKHKLYSTHETGALIEKELKLPIKKFEGGPFGGYQQLKGKITSRELDILIFFVDALESHPATQEILRLAHVYDIVCATTAATVDFFLNSMLMNETHVRRIQLSEANEMIAAVNTTAQDNHDKNLHLYSSIENVCIWLEQNGLEKYCDLFRVQKPQTSQLEIASAHSSKDDVKTIVTNNFIRYGQNNQIVMTGSARVVKIPDGTYTAADLCKLWHENNSSPRSMINSEYVKIIRNIQWRHKSAIGSSAEVGDLIFPSNFDGNLPTVLATAENLKYYGCSVADETQIKVSLTIEHEARVYTYNPNNIEEWVLGKNGPGLERHDFTHFDMPHTADNGWFVLGKFNDENETELHLTAFIIPAGRTLLIPANTIHSNDYLKNEWRTLLATADIDRVLLKRQRHAGKALQPFAFDFPGQQLQNSYQAEFRI